MSFETRDRMLEAARLEVVDGAWSGQVPGPAEAWRLIIGGSVVPSSTVGRRSGSKYLDEIDALWRRLGSEAGIFDCDKDFLVSVGGAGLGSLPWARVRCGCAPVMVHHLAEAADEPEFVAMSIDGTVVCGVTTEEYDIWVISKRFE